MNYRITRDKGIIFSAKQNIYFTLDMYVDA
jgi:hypothetical protein